MRAVQINDVVHEVLGLLRPLFRDDVFLRTDLAEGLPHICADASEVEQVLVNLIVNALDAMPEGGELKISTSLADTNPGITSEPRTQQFVAVSVSDTGTGIPEELQPVIFEPFFTTKPAGKGTGLGLSSAYGIVRQHKGDIKVQSEPGDGATFIVSFPVPQTLSSKTDTAA